MAIRFMAIMENKNRPVYFRSFDKPDTDSTGSSESTVTHSINQQFIAEMSIDYIEGLAHSARSDAVGLLLVHDGIAVYGALANTGIITLVGIDAYDKRQLPIDSIVHKLQDCYVNYVSNPFYQESKPVGESVAFNAKTEAIYQQFSETLEEIKI